MSGYSVPALLEMLREPCGEPDCGHCGLERQSADEIERLQEEVADLRGLFDLQWARTQEADAAYVAAHPRPDYPHGYRPDLGKLIGWLLEFYRHVEAEPCNCVDEWGNLKPQSCERCRLLGQRLREAPHPMLCVQHGGSPACEAQNAAIGLPCPKCQPEPAKASKSPCRCRRCLREHGVTFGGLLAEWCLLIVCPVCGNKRCPKASDHRLACTNSNELGQPVSVDPSLESHQ